MYETIIATALLIVLATAFELARPQLPKYPRSQDYMMPRDAEVALARIDDDIWLGKTRGYCVEGSSDQVSADLPINWGLEGLKTWRVEPAFLACD